MARWRRRSSLASPAAPPWRRGSRATPPPRRTGSAGPSAGRSSSGSKSGENDGIDILAAVGEWVHAAGDGVCIYAGDDIKTYGKLVLIRHANGYVTAYADNSDSMSRRATPSSAGRSSPKPAPAAKSSRRGCISNCARTASPSTRSSIWRRFSRSSISYSYFNMLYESPTLYRNIYLMIWPSKSSSLVFLGFFGFPGFPAWICLVLRFGIAWISSDVSRPDREFSTGYRR